MNKLWIPRAVESKSGPSQNQQERNCAKNEQHAAGHSPWFRQSMDTRTATVPELSLLRRIFSRIGASGHDIGEYLLRDLL